MKPKSKYPGKYVKVTVDEIHFNGRHLNALGKEKAVAEILDGNKEKDKSWATKVYEAAVKQVKEADAPPPPPEAKLPGAIEKSLNIGDGL
jgi:hypothetical protein